MDKEEATIVFDLLRESEWKIFYNYHVLFEDDSNNYKTSLTKSMTVPPMHTEVNIGLTASCV